MQLLSARRFGPTFNYRVHLDETKLDAQGQPDTSWVLSLSWSDRPRDLAETVPQFTARLTAFEAMARAEMRLLCLARRDVLALPADVALPGEGQNF